MRIRSSIILSLLLSLPPTCIRADTLPPVTNIADCATLPEADIARKRGIDLMGMVMHLTKPQSRLWLRDAHFAIDAQGRLPPDIRTGQVVRVRGYTDLHNNQYLCQITNMAVMSGAALPPVDALDSELQGLSARTPAGRFVTVRGTITEAFADDIDPDFTYFELRDDATTLHAAIFSDEITPQTVDELIGAEVRMTGVYSPHNASFRRYMGPILFVHSPADIRTLRPAVHNPYEYPDCPREKS